MLTKEEAQEYLDDLKIIICKSSNCKDFYPERECEDCRSNHNFEGIQQLIEEHFNNPPLKFEELKARMWLWDNLDEEYIRVLSVDENSHYINYWRSGVYRGSKYLENRFYRKEIK